MLVAAVDRGIICVAELLSVNYCGRIVDVRQDVLDLKNRDGKGITTTVAPTCMTFPSGEEGSSAVNRCHIGSEDGGVYSVVRHGSSQGISDKLEGHYGTNMLDAPGR